MKRNFVLVLGVSLPVMLIAALLLVHGISRLTATKPDYPVLYVSFETYAGELFYDIDIDPAGRLEIAFRLPEDNPAAVGPRSVDATLGLYDARSGALETFRLEPPDDPPPGQRFELAVPGPLSSLTFSERATAPDGYRLELSGYRGGGLLRELFGTGGRTRHHRLVNDGASFRVPDIGSSRYAYRDAFVAWVVDEDE